MENEVEVGRPPGIKHGTTMNFPFAVQTGPMPLAADQTFEWVLTVGDKKWHAPFTTRPLQQQATT
jgi:hypothetical protein